MEQIFSGNVYTTRQDYPRSGASKVFLRTRMGFYFQYLYRVLGSRSDAVRGIYDDSRWVFRSYEIFKDIEGYGGRFHIEGFDHLKQGGEPYVIVGNHMSTLETMTLPCMVRPFFPVTFVMKDSLVKSWLTGPIMRSRDPIIVGRKNPREDLKAVLEKGKELLMKGISIILFPQSQRVAHFSPADFNSLGVKLAKSVGAKVIPLALKTDFWGIGRLIKEVGRIDRRIPIRFEFGEPFSVEGNGSSAQERIVQFITDRMHAWGGTVKTAEATS